MTRTIDGAGVRQLIIDHVGRGSVSLVRESTTGVDVEPGAGAEAGDVGRVSGTIDGSDQEYLSRVEVWQSHDQLRISVPRDPFRSSVYVELTVPDHLSCAITTGSADVAVSANIQRSKITTGSGDIAVDSGRDVRLGSGSGSITVGELTGRQAQLSSGSGNIRVERAEGPVQAKSASGEVVVGSLSGELRASSASGDISVPSSTGTVDLRTASGALEVGVADGLPAWLDLSSVGGRIEIELDADHGPGEDEPYVSIRARSASGRISVYRA